MTEQEIAAHRVADALRTIAECLPLLSVEQLNAYDPHPQAHEYLEHVIDAYKNRAARLDASVPFTPLNDEERERWFEALYEDECDSTPKDRARAAMGNPEWMLRTDYDSYLELIGEEE